MLNLRVAGSRGVHGSREQMTGLSDALRARTVTVSENGAVTTVVRSFDPATKTETTTVWRDGGTPVIRSTKFGALVETHSLADRIVSYFDAFLTPYHVRTFHPVTGALRSRRFLDMDEATWDPVYTETWYGSLKVTGESQFDAFGRETVRIDALGNAVTNAFDALGSLVAASGATYPVAHGYDTAGRMMALSTTRDGNAWDTTQWIYDPATGRATAKTYADDSSIAYTYTAEGRPTRTTWARGEWREHTYNADGLLSGTTYSDATPAVSLTYDAFFRLTTASNAVAAYAYVNSALGTATNEIAMVGGEVFTLTRGLDNRQRLASLNVGAAQVHYAYDAENRLATVSNDVFTVTYAYTPVGLDAGYAVTLTNGVVLARALTRDLYRRGLVRTITNRVDGVAVNPLAYDYDVLNRVTTRNADALSYNARSEVISAMIEPGHTNRYEFDGIGNALWTSLNTATNSYTANALNQYTAISNLVQSCNPVHDLDGNMLTNGAWSYTWDAENRLTGVASNGIHVVTNAYDYMNRRVTKTTAVKVTHFIWDGWNIVAEIAVDRQTGETNLTRYVWGLDLSGTLQGAGGVGGLLAVSIDGQYYMPCIDNNGNISAYIDETGTLVAMYVYDAFGCTIDKSGPMAGDFSFRFPTKNFDPETGLYYYGYRFYSPELMRWMNRDPIEEIGGINLFAFCINRPINGFDLLGFDTYLLFWGDEDGVPFQQAAIGKKAQIEASSQFNPTTDQASVIAVKSFADIQNSLKNTNVLKRFIFMCMLVLGSCFLT